MVSTFEGYASKHINENTSEIDISGIDSDDETLSTDVPSDTSSVVSGNTSSSASTDSSSTDPPPSWASSSINGIPPPPPPKNYYNRPRTVLVPDAINKKKK